ncbi:MAG: hypothetical protein ACRCW4_00470 [Candidatus Neomicrothrix subdominans]
MTADDDEDHGHELVMPFVVVRSQGGHYDDESYAAGWEMGRLASQLDLARAMGLGLPHATIHPENVAQADLVAMRVGAQMIVKEWPEGTHPEAAAEWTWVNFEWTMSTDWQPPSVGDPS